MTYIPQSILAMAGHPIWRACGLVLLILALLAPGALAAEPRTGDMVDIAPGEVINDDLYAAGTIVVIEGEVNGDVLAAAETIVINGTVNGSVWAAGRVVQIPGKISGSVHVAAQYVAISGRIGRDVQGIAQVILLPEGSLVNGDVTIAAYDAGLQGGVGRDVRGNARRLVIAGPVAGNVDVEAQIIRLADTAAIGGNITYTSRDILDEKAGAKVNGEKIRIDPDQLEKERRAAEPWTAKLPGAGLSLLMALVVGLVLTLATPNQSAEIAWAVRHHPWSSLGWGLAVAFGGPPLVLIAMFTIVGIPLALILLALYGICLYVAQVFVSLALGRLIMGRWFPTCNHPLMVFELVLGLVLLVALREVPVPYFGLGTSLVVMVFGAGAIAATHWGQPAHYKAMVTAGVTASPVEPVVAKPEEAAIPLGPGTPAPSSVPSSPQPETRIASPATQGTDKPAAPTNHVPSADTGTAPATTASG